MGSDKPQDVLPNQESFELAQHMKLFLELLYHQSPESPSSQQVHMLAQLAKDYECIPVIRSTLIPLIRGIIAEDPVLAVKAAQSVEDEKGFTRALEIIVSQWPDAKSRGELSPRLIPICERQSQQFLQSRDKVYRQLAFLGRFQTMAEFLVSSAYCGFLAQKVFSYRPSSVEALEGLRELVRITTYTDLFDRCGYPELPDLIGRIGDGLECGSELYGAFLDCSGDNAGDEERRDLNVNVERAQEAWCSKQDIRHTFGCLRARIMEILGVWMEDDFRAWTVPKFASSPFPWKE
jgi:hypothetical protein